MIVLIIIVIIIVFAFIVNNSSQSKPKDKTDYYSAAQKNKVSFNLSFEESDSKIPYYLFFDCETTGLPKYRNGDINDFSNWPYIVQLAWSVFDESGKIISLDSYIIKQNVIIPPEVIRKHGITNQRMKAEGVSPSVVFGKIADAIGKIDFLVAHNISFDFPILSCELKRNKILSNIDNCLQICTMRSGMEFCGLQKSNGGLKMPKLSELVGCLFYNNPYISIDELHDASIDISLTAKCFFKLFDLGQLYAFPNRNIDITENSNDNVDICTIPDKPDFGRISLVKITDESLKRMYRNARAEYNNYWKITYGSPENPVKLSDEKRKYLVFNLKQNENKLRNIIAKINEKSGN